MVLDILMSARLITEKFPALTKQGLLINIPKTLPNIREEEKIVIVLSNVL